MLCRRHTALVTGGHDEETQEVAACPAMADEVSIEARTVDSCFFLYLYFTCKQKFVSSTQNTDRTLLLQSLQAARAVVPDAAARLPLSGSLLLGQFMDLLVLSHARGKLCTQVNERLLQEKIATGFHEASKVRPNLV